MMKFTFIFLILSMAWNSFAGTNLLDLLKAGKAQYSTTYCQSFIQSANHQTLLSDDLKKLTVKAKDSKFIDEYYFHYTNAAILLKTLKNDTSDREAAQKEIVRDGGYKSIMEYQMTYSDALSNVSGVGFYIAANPFSSQGYGNYQIALKVDPNANFLDLVKYSAQYQIILAKIVAKYPAFSSCDKDLQLSLIMNENGVDMVHYDQASEWIVTFNEDIFVQSRITNVGTSASASAIIAKLVSNGDGAAVIEYISDLKLNPTYAKISLDNLLKLLPASKTSGQSAVLKLAEALKSSWSDGLKLTFAKLISNRSGTELTDSIQQLSSNGMIPESTYLNIPLSSSSKDFNQWVASKIKSNPREATNWKSLYSENISTLYKNDLVDIDFVIGMAPSEFDKAKFFTSYGAMGNKNKISEILLYLAEKEGSLFQSLDTELKFDIFNDFIKNAAPADISRFTAAIDENGYPTKASFSYILGRPTLLGVNGLHFIASYIKLKKDPNLLTDDVITKLNSVEDLNPDFTLYLLQNKSTYGVQASKYAFVYLNGMTIDELDPLLKSNIPTLLSKTESDIILSKLLADNDPKSAALLNRFIQTFSTTPAEMAKMISSTGPKLSIGSGLEAIKYVRADSTAWSSFSDIKNTSGMKSILSFGKSHQALQSYLIKEATSQLLSNPDQLPMLADHVMNELLQSSRLNTYFSHYSEAQKLEMAKKVRKYNPSEAKQFMAGVQYDRQMVQANFNSLMAYNSASELEDLLNNPSFVSVLTDFEFERLVKSITSFKNEINMRTLLRSGVLNFSRSTTLALSLEKYHGEDNLDEILENQLNFDELNSEEKEALLKKYSDKFLSISQLAKDKLWSLLFTYASLEKRDYFVKGFSSMSRIQKDDLLSNYAGTSERIKRGIEVFNQNGLNYVTLVIDQDNNQTTAATIGYIENSYPIKEEYALHLIKTYQDNMNSSPILSSHLKSHVCRKVNKWYAFDEILDNCKDKEEKKYLKERRKLLCK